MTPSAPASNFPRRDSWRSSGTIQWTSFSASKKYLRQTMPRKAPPKAPSGTWALVRMRAYSAGSSAASRRASQGFTQATTLTTTSGNTSRIPKTAMAMPQVRKRWRQSGVMSRSTEALTTALSKESETSRTDRTATMKTVLRMPSPVCR